MCSLAVSIQKSVDDSNLYYFKDKGSIKITSKLKALGRAFLSAGSNRLDFDKIRIYFTSISGPYAVRKENWSKKIDRSEFLQTTVSNLLYTSLKKTTEKL